jgi:ribonucleoside-diphosphate reductase beta chain
MVLEGAVFTAGQRALLDDLEDDALPGIREGVTHVELDERWHVGFGVRCLTEAGDPEFALEEVLTRATEAAGAWGSAVPLATREYAVSLCRRRLAIAGLAETLPAAEGAA